MLEDLLTLDDRSEEGEPLIHPVMRAGRRLAPPAPLAKMRAYAAEQLARLPEPFRELRDVPPYPVKIADALTALANKVDAETRRERPR
jgi:nicotinate phosphoribosyltransferase